MDMSKGRRNGVMPIYFYNIVPNNNSKRLKIPNEAIKRCGGNNIPNPVLISPIKDGSKSCPKKKDGSKWKVFLRTSNGEVWLDVGWKEFAQHYSLDYGHFLVFKFQGSPQLDVLIFAKSAVELHFGPTEQSSIDLPSHFFKTIVQSNIERAKIPTKFVRRFGSKLPNPVILRPTDGSEWEVHWSVDNDGFWLEKGWKEFCEKYMLAIDEVVLFKYEGTSHMSILIFDENKVERHIKGGIKKRAMKVKLEDISDDDSVMILEVPPAGMGKRKRRNNNKKSVAVKERPSSSRRSTSHGLKDNQMTNMAKEYPDFFKVFLPEKHSERMLIPDAFVRLTRSQGRVVKDIILRDRRGSEWRVKARPIGEKIYFDDGWKRFREENSLQDRDFIVFTHVERNVFKFKILELSSMCEKIKINDEEGKNNPMEMEEEEEQDNDDEDEDENENVKMIENACKARDIASSSAATLRAAARSFSSSSPFQTTSVKSKDNPMTNMAKEYPDFFRVFLPEKHSQRMLIPDVFMTLTRSKGRIVKDVILRDSRGREWQVKAHPIGDKLYFDKGWKQFREENSLEDRDTIVFTHVGRNVFKCKILELSSKCEKIKDDVEKNNMMEMEEEEEQDDDDDDGDEDDYDYDDDDDDDDDEEEEEEEDYDVEMKETKGEYKGKMRVQHHCRACKARDIASSSTNPGLEDLEIDAEMYVQEGNPYFIAKLIKYRPNELHVPKNIMKEFSLGFPKHITLVCCQCQDIHKDEVEEYHLSLAQNITICKKHTQWRGEVCTWRDGRVCVLGWTGFRRKNKIKENDACICEIVMQEGQTIEMRVHVARK